MKLSNKHKKDFLRFALAGVAAVIIKKIEGAINKKADEHFPDEETPQQN
jgi:hypothetical protein